jgi:hypothetical protein
MIQKPIFRSIESKEATYLQLWVAATIISLTIVLTIFGLLMTLYPNLILSAKGEKILLFIFLGVLIFNFIICEAKKYYLKKSTSQYTKVIINNTGITFSNHYNETIIAKILWENIQPRVNEKYDIDYLLRSRSIYNIYFLWSLKESSNSKIPHWSANKFALMFVKFTNKADLLKAFLSGIATFRPEITINPLLYGLYRLNPINLEVDKIGIKKENKMIFLIILFSILLSLIITFLIYLFSL